MKSRENKLAKILTRLENISRNKNISQEQLNLAKNLISEAIDEIKINNTNEASPEIELLWHGELNPNKKSYIHGISKSIKPYIQGPAEKLEIKLSSIFNGLDRYLERIAKNQLENPNTRESKKEIAEFKNKNWHSLANSIATHIRHIHKNAESPPKLLYISLDKSTKSAKIVVLEDPSRGEISSKLHPDTKGINMWIEKLNL